MANTSGRRIVVAALAIGVLVLAPAAQAKPVAPAIEILSPQRGAVHVAARKQPLRVRVRVAPGVRRLSAVVARGTRQRVVTTRFRVRGGGIRVATLRPGRELRPGPAAIRLSGRRAGKLVATSAHFWVASRRTELLQVRELPRRSPARPLEVRLQTPKRVDDLRVRVNGRNARDAFTRTLDGRWRGSLSASAGLRFGRNRITITAYTRRGGFERVRRIVRVRRGRPLVGAGKDVLMRQRDAIRLDGRDTRPRKGERLRFTWRVVRRPKGSKARLRKPHAVRPRLRADRRGVYRLRLTVRSVPKASAAAAQSFDTVNVSAQPAVAPEGLRVQTISVDDQSGPGIQVGSNWYPMNPPSVGGAAAFQLVVLDGTTTEGLLNESFPGSDFGAELLAETLESVGDGSIVLITQPSGSSVSITQQGANALEEVWAALDFQPDISNWRITQGEPGFFTYPVGWSVVGVPASGAMRGLVGVQQTPGSQPGAMDGFLQNSAQTEAGALGSTYVFNWPNEFIQYDTSSGGDGVATNQMTIDGATYTSDTIASGSSAFHLVWLDGGTLQKLGEATVPGNQGQQLAQTLQSISNSGPAMLFMTTIGQPSIPRPQDGSDAGWAVAATQIQSFGGNPNAFLALDGSANAQYSLVGASASGNLTPNAGVDVSRNLQPSVPKPRLIGVLDRRPAGAYEASTGGASTGTSDAAALIPDIKRVLAQPDQPFQPFDGPGEAKAEQYIAEKLDISAADPTYGIRANYWNPGLDPQWTNLEEEIGDPDIVPQCPSEPCHSAFPAVQKQLDQEFAAVAKVRTYFGNYSDGTLYEAFNNEFISGTWSFDQISEYITSKYPPQESEASGPSPFDIVEGMLDLSAELVPEGGEALGVAGAAVEIAGAFSEGTEGSGYLGATVFEAQAAQFASTLTTGYTNSLSGLNRIADLLVSDAGRLQAAGDAVLNDWAVDGNDLNATLDRSIAAYMWASLLPTTFTAYQCVMPPVYFPPEDFRPSPWYPNDVNTPTALQYPIATVTNWPVRTPGGWAPFGNPVQQVNNVGYLTVGGEIAGDFTYLDGGVAADLFGPLDPSDPTKLGLLPAYLLAPQTATGGAGFALDQGAYSGSPDDNFVRFDCAQDEWREDTNQRGQ